jgi:hypothetical protein
MVGNKIRSVLFVTENWKVPSTFVHLMDCYYNLLLYIIFQIIFVSALGIYVHMLRIRICCKANHAKDLRYRESPLFIFTVSKNVSSKIGELHIVASVWFVEWVIFNRRLYSACTCCNSLVIIINCKNDVAVVITYT